MGSDGVHSIRITKSRLEKYGFSRNCSLCKRLQAGLPPGDVQTHSETCRKRIHAALVAEKRSRPRVRGRPPTLPRPDNVPSKTKVSTRRKGDDDIIEDSGADGARRQRVRGIDHITESPEFSNEFVADLVV